ncbi:signal-regulatory protein delta-like [Dromaius novaehollandiae]|uniref:signal-regulatory protein delta-like n=1 Tax=Dromaius novaehollandiae TaxID=8790 RepID=UPI00311FFE2F
MALRAAAAAPLLVGLLSLCPAPLAGAGAGAAGAFELRQPQGQVSVSVGQTLTLHCTVSGDAVAGPVRWLKPSGGRNRTIYDQKGSFPRVTRAANGSNTDFTIRIRDARPDDAGTYYCVKLQADAEERVYCSGPGTAVHVREGAPFPSAAVAATVLSVLLLGFCVALCVYRRMRGGGSAGSPSTHVPDAETSAPAGQRPGAADADLHYADLQHLPAAPRRAPGPGTAGSEYASIRVAAR